MVPKDLSRCRLQMGMNGFLTLEDRALIDWKPSEVKESLRKPSAEQLLNLSSKEEVRRVLVLCFVVFVFFCFSTQGFLPLEYHCSIF